MSPSKEEIKNWLKENNFSYEWLAERCLVKYGTVKNWMAKTDIPAAKLALIKSLMDETSKEEEEEEEITLDFTDEEMKVVERFRKVFPNVDIAEYARGKVFELCSSMMNPIEQDGNTESSVEEQSPFKAPMSKEEVEEAKYRDVMQYWDEEKQDFIMPWDEERKRRGGDVIYPREDKSEESKAE